MRWPFTFFTRFSTLIYRRKKYIFDEKFRKEASKILVDLVYTYIQGFSLTSFKNKKNFRRQKFNVANLGTSMLCRLTE